MNPQFLWKFTSFVFLQTKELTFFNPKNSPIKSWFVPIGLEIHFKGQDNVEYGPFIGMFAYSPENIATFDQVKVLQMDRDKFQDAADNIMICNSKWLTLRWINYE